MMKNKKVEGKKKIFNYFVIFTLIFFIFQANSCKKDTKKERIKKIIINAVDFLKDGDKEKLLNLVDENYKDPMGRDKDEVEYLLNRHFERLKRIRFKVLGIRFTSVEDAESRVAMDVATSNAALESFKKLAKRYEEFYRVLLVFIKRGNEWKVISADWRYILREDLFKESLEVIEKD